LEQTGHDVRRYHEIAFSRKELSMNLKRITSSLAGLILLAAFATACAPRTNAGLEGTSWTLVSIEPGTAEGPTQSGAITLTFEAGGKAGGKAGCNSYGGSYDVKDNTIAFREVNSTLIACTDDKLMAQEQTFLKALLSTGEFKLDRNSLVISYDDGRGKLIFERVSATRPAHTDSLPLHP
jgi:heat shock protein HslJ